MNKVAVSGEVSSCRDEAWNGRKFLNFVVDTKETYKDKVTGEMKSWSTRVKCTYEHPNFAIGIGDYVYIDGKLTVRAIESEKGKAWVTEVRCNEVQIVKVMKKMDFNFGPPAAKQEEVPF